MSSSVLFPPLVNSYEPAFLVGSSSSLKVFFSLSSLSNIPKDTELSVQAQIYRQDGVKVLNTVDDHNMNRYRASGILLNLSPIKTDIDNYYYVTINNSDLSSSVTLEGKTYNGWIPGWIYKVQLRLSTVKYNPSTNPKQESWLQENSNNFSEWSTICYVKAITPMVLKIPVFNYDSSDVTKIYDPDTIYSLKTIDFSGTLESGPSSGTKENFEHVRILLYRNEELLEDSGEIYQIEQSKNYFEYKFKTRLKNGLTYRIQFSYKTENEYVLPEPLEYNFTLEEFVAEPLEAFLTTVDENHNSVFDGISSVDEEEDEGRIGLKIYSPNNNSWSGNICIRRASQVDNFTTWEDIKIIIVKQQNLNDLPVIYDYTIESGVWYKYGIQPITKIGERGVLNEIAKPIQRLFNYSYLIGMGGKQLKLSYNNNISSFKHQIYDSKTDTIGSKYPYITRNGTVNYRVFPIEALITAFMDENNTFIKNKKELYKYNNIVNLYEDYITNNNRQYLDYTYEKDFRAKVLEFLQDGKPKLFKSPTEGNIIVRLTDISCTPNQTLDRMLYSVNMTANEIDDNNMKNYLKYGFYTVGTYGNDFSVTTAHIGQITGKFKTTDNIFQKIYEKYDSQGKNYGGYTRKLESISRVNITINGYYYNILGEMKSHYVPNHQLRIYNNQGTLVMGNNIRLKYSGSPGELLITIYDPRGQYQFDELLTFYYKGGSITNDYLYLLGDAEGLVDEIDATIDFVYNLSTEVYEAHQIAERHPIRKIGQFYGEITPGTSLYNIIYYQHYVESDTFFKYLNTLSSIEIEANPHTVFAISDGLDQKPSYHEINDSGVLRLYELSNIKEIRYIGKRYLKTPHNEETVSDEIITESTLDKDNHYILNASADISLTYHYVDIAGTYKSK